MPACGEDFADTGDCRSPYRIETLRLLNAALRLLHSLRGDDPTKKKRKSMPSAVCEITKFPVATEFARRGVRRCGCAACEAHARWLASQSPPETEHETQELPPQN